jgi:hypothetical protein
MRPFIRRSLEACFAACFGIVGGLAASAFWRRGLARESVTEAHASPIAIVSVPGADAVDPVSRATAPASSTRAAAIEPVKEPATSMPSTTDAAESKDPDEQMREADRLHEQRHEASLRAHRNEPRDAKWARATERMLEADLVKVSDKAKFKVVGVDCRMTTCVSILQWSSYDEALRGYGATFREPFEVNCGQEVLLPAPADPRAPYQASMVFDCEGWRAAGN